MNQNKKHNDAGEGVYFAQQLELAKLEVFKVLYPDLKYPIAIPTDVRNAPGVQRVSFQMRDIVGVAKIIANYADDIPRADLVGRKVFLEVFTLGISCGWNYYEMEAGILAGEPIDTAKMAAAREVLLRLVDKLAFLGDASVGLFGLTNVPSMPNTVVPTVGGATTWAAKLALGTDAGRQAVLDDLMLPFTRQFVLTRMTERPDTIVLSPTSFAQISQTPRTAFSDTTILDFFLKAHPEVEVISSAWLETSGTGGARQMIVYRRDPSKIELQITQDIHVHEPEKRGLEWVVAMTMRYAGILARYPLSLDSSYGM